MYAENVEVRLTDGSLWVGVIGQTISVEYTDKGTVTKFEGEITRATSTYIMVADEFLFIENIVSISGEGEDIPEQETSDESSPEDDSSTDDISIAKKPVKIIKEGDLPKGVFCLPLHEMVGTYFRDNEITQLIDHIEENYGLGQIIVP